MIIEVPEIGLALHEYKGSTCWQLYQFATGRKAKATGEALPDEWVAMEKYPRTLAGGLEMMLEYAARKSTTRGDLEAAVAEVNAASAAIVAAVERMVGDE